MAKSHDVKIARELADVCHGTQSQSPTRLLSSPLAECLIEDPATGLLRPRDYMQSLEARVAYLEGLLQQVRPDVAQDHLVGFEKGHIDLPPGASPRPPAASIIDGPGVNRQSATYDEAQARASADIEDPADQLSSDVALLCLSAAGKEPHYFGPSSAVSFSRIVSAAMKLPKKPGGSQFSLPAGDERGQTTWRSFPVCFPTPAVAMTLSKAYFDNLHPQYPFLHRPAFQIWQEACLQADASGNLSAAGDVALFFVWMVRVVDDIDLDGC